MYCFLGDGHASPQFSTVECAVFERRYEEGYDIPDERYEEWLALNKQPKAPTRILSEFLKTPKPPVGKKGINAPPAKSRVLTSADYVQLLEEKDRKKREMIEAKEKRKEDREVKRLLKLQEKEEKLKKKKEKKNSPKKPATATDTAGIFLLHARYNVMVLRSIIIGVVNPGEELSVFLDLTYHDDTTGKLHGVI